MTVQLFANNAKTTLASPINATQTTITVAPGTGSLFPNPSSGQAFKVTLVSAASSTVFEICLCTARSNDTLTVVRAQEGTTGTPFLLNDIVGNYDTAGVMDGLVQSTQLQNQYYLFAVAGGTANALTATIPSNLTALTDGMSIVVKSAYANTGATSLNLTLGSTATGVLPIVSGNNTPLVGSEIPSAGYPITLSYSSTYNAWVITDGNVNLNAYALVNSQTFTGTPRVPTAPFNDNSTIIASTSWVQGQLANYAPIYNPTLTGIPKAPTAPVGTNTTQIATTAFVKSQISSPSVVFRGYIAYNSTTTFTLDPNRFTMFFINEGNGAGGNTGLYLGVQYGINSVGENNRQFFNSGVDYQVTFAGALMDTYPAGNSQLLIQPYGNYIGGYGAPSSAWCTIIQF